MSIGQGGHPSIAANGQSLYFHRSKDLWVMTRDGAEDEWENPIRLNALINSGRVEARPSISSDGRELYFTRHDGFGVGDIWVARRETTEDDWQEPTKLGQNINQNGLASCPETSHDGLTLFYCIFGAHGGFGDYDMWMSRRSSLGSDWEDPINLGPEVNSNKTEGDAFLAADGSALYFSRGNNVQDSNSL